MRVVRGNDSNFCLARARPRPVRAQLSLGRAACAGRSTVTAARARWSRATAQPMLAVLVVAAAAAAPAPKPPNLLLLFPDQWRWDFNELSQGEALIQTPTFAALAKRGSRFEKAYVPSPLCAPSRAALAVLPDVEAVVDAYVTTASLSPPRPPSFTPERHAVGARISTNRPPAPLATVTPCRPLGAVDPCESTSSSPATT